MADATVTKTEYGFSVTGGTTATKIASGKLWVKAMGFAGNAANATATLTSLPNDTTGTAISCGKFRVASGDSSDLDVGANRIYFGDKGVPFNNLSVTLGNTDSILYVYLTR